MDSSSSGEALTSERLAEIARLSYHQEKYAAGEMRPTDSLDIDLALRDLLAEVRRLRAREEALAAIVRAVAEKRQGMFGTVRDVVLCYNDNAGELECPWCDGQEVNGSFKHETDCPVTQARALLASEAAHDG